MIYSSVEFVALWAAVLACYLALGRPGPRVWLLLAASLVFYAWAGLFDLALFLAVVAISYAAVLSASRWPRRRGLLLAAGVAALLAHMLFWKYGAWVFGGLQALWPGLGGGRAVVLHLPLGISFFTFTGIAFLLDFYRGKTPLVPFRDYLLFHSLFSHLLAGPIVRAEELLPQLRALASPSAEDLAVGLALFSRGLFKKMVVADRVAPFVDIVFSAPGKFGRAELACAAAAATVQLWADFSGYTDMGRGTARVFGLRLPENFLSPLLYRKPSEFWERWHVTLARWMRDYVWAPMARWPLSSLVTMLLVGLWHGANWTFLLWGFYIRVLIIAERLLERSALGRAWERLLPDRARRLLLLPVAWVLAALGFALFRSRDLEGFAAYLVGLALGSPTSGASVLAAFRLPLAVSVGSALTLELLFYRRLPDGEWVLGAWLSRLRARLSWLPRPQAEWAAGLALGAGFAVLAVAAIALRQYENYEPFFYFRF